MKTVNTSHVFHVKKIFSSLGDECVRECGVGGICVFDSTRTEQFCVCADGYTNEGNGVCRGRFFSYD